MTQAVEGLIERRRLRRSLTLWRVGAVVLALITIVALISSIGARTGGLSLQDDHVARVEINGFIGPDRPLLELLEKLEEDDNVKAVLLDINSPGGAASAGEALYESIRALAKEKPVVAHIDSLGTSAAYMAAIATDHIVTRRSAITGSIGVLAQFGEVSELLDKLGVNVTELRSGNLKAVPSPFRPPEDASIASLEAILSDTYDWFVSIVVERREIADIQVRGFQGRAFTGTQALDAGLIDALGGEDVSRKWLADNREIDEELPLLKREPKRPRSNDSFGVSVRDIARLWEGDTSISFSPQDIRNSIREALALDGVLSVWQAPNITAPTEKTK